jgi:hypothetical protein
MRSGMVLIGVLSNPDFKDLLQCLTSKNRHKGGKDEPLTNGPRPDGRRRFGSVSSAIVSVLTEAQSDMRVREIQAEVERLRGEPVSPSRPAVVSSLARGRYRLVRR